MKKAFLLAVLVLVSGYSLKAQTFSISTNLVDWANMLTVNGEAGLSLGQHFSLMAGGRYNPWTMESKRHDTIVQEHQRTGYAGVRYWPWYVYSGWWLSVKGQYQEMAQCGLWRPEYEASTAIGACLSGGYSIMLNKHFNLEFGLGLFGGRYTKYEKYECADCLDLISEGPRNFLSFDDLYLTVSYLF